MGFYTTLKIQNIKVIFIVWIAFIYFLKKCILWKDRWKYFCGVEMSKKAEFNQNKKSDRAPFIIYAYLEYLIKKIDGSKYKPEILSTI